ncbi:MAG: helicase protein [Micavibrio sp.]|nr:helicase protein [Micavibrio sp.]
MILNSQPKQLRLQDDGQILWQKDATNPMPGIPVAKITKGSSALTPGIELIESEALEGQERDDVSIFVKNWLGQHIITTLEKLVGLNAEGIEGPTKDIAQKVYLALGIIPRAEIETEIAALDAEMRKALRQRHVRLGPILVFVPELNKPAAIRLRALLWWLWNDRVLPAPVPKDGVVSVIVDETEIDPVYQRAIGYPVYGGRAIRVDMLDRLICAVYDNAKDGKFKATHKMAEWLGSSIPDLYKVLEAMGHKKLEDKAEAPKSEEAAAEAPSEAAVEAIAEPAVEPVAEETPAEATAGEVTPEVTTEATPADTAATPAISTAPVKPDLATFRLKRGKAGESEKARAPRGPRRAPKVKTPPPFEKLSEEELAAIRERDKAREDARQQRKTQQNNDRPKEKDSRPRDGQRDNPRDRKPRDRNDRLKGGDAREDKVVLEVHAPKTGDSPFAMLQQLKVGRKD